MKYHLFITVNLQCDTFPLYWRPVCLDECGIVAQISQPLADSDISAYYISTFSFDHALVSHNLFTSSLMLTRHSRISRWQVGFVWEWTLDR